MRFPLGAIILGSIITLGGCSSGGLKQFTKGGNGPEEFMVLPVKPLTDPTNYSSLPIPTPGGSNLVDPNPRADAVVALGGRASALDNTGVPSGDAALVAHASRYGVQSDVRADLAEEDAKFRKRKTRATRWRLFSKDRYSEAYKKSATNPFDETKWLRRGGVNTPTSPPSSNN